MGFISPPGWVVQLQQKIFREGLKEAEVCKLSQKESLCQIPGHQPKVSTRVLNLRFLEINSLKLLFSVFMPDRRLKRPRFVVLDINSLKLPNNSLMDIFNGQMDNSVQ